MASGIARGHVRTTATVESRKMAAILQIIGLQRHAALVFLVLFRYMTSCYDQLTPVNKQLLDDVFVISGIIKVEVSVISRSRRLRLITLTETLIIPGYH